ncbi:MAG: hypothetical protein IIA45_15355 [Bacteroidetes bacterium]|nr:hypothetical protein [Bacteroidota bacterium]
MEVNLDNLNDLELVEYFILKFHRIPEKKWTRGTLKEDDARCALGHCDVNNVHELSKEAKLLGALYTNYLLDEENTPRLYYLLHGKNEQLAFAVSFVNDKFHTVEKECVNPEGSGRLNTLFALYKIRSILEEIEVKSMIELRKLMYEADIPVG